MNLPVLSSPLSKRFGASLGAALIALAMALSAQAELVTNGSFETNSAGGTSYNLSNAGLSGLVSGVTGFGGAQEIDLITNTNFGLAPQDGNWKLGLHAQTSSVIDAFAFALSSPLVIGTTYQLSFYAANDIATWASVAVGVSNNATSFGSQIFYSSFSTTGWQHFTQSFVATGTESFLTVQAPEAGSYVSVDNFSVTVATPATVPDTAATLGLLAAGMVFLAGVRRRLQA